MDKPTQEQIDEANKRVQGRRMRGSKWATDARIFRKAYRDAIANAKTPDEQAVLDAVDGFFSGRINDARIFGAAVRKWRESR